MIAFIIIIIIIKTSFFTIWHEKRVNAKKLLILPPKVNRQHFKNGSEKTNQRY